MIIYISSFYPSNDELFRGHYVEKQAQLLSDELNQELIVFQPHFSIRHLKPKLKQKRVNNISVYSFYFPNFLRKYTIFHTTKWVLKYFKRDIEKILNHTDVNLIVSNDLSSSIKFGNILSKKYNSKHYTVIHGETLTENSSTYIKYKTLSELENCDMVFAVSTQIENYLKDIVGFEGKIIINPNGLNQSLIKKYSNFLFEKNDILTITSVGNLQHNKGFDIVLDALKSIDLPYKYYIVGDGNYREDLLEQINRYELEEKIILTGNVSNGEVYNILEKSHFFILPSRREAFGIVYLEGMITKNICIGTKGQGPEEFIVNGENGFLISNAEEISEIISNYSSIRKSNLIENGFETAKKYTWERNVMTIKEIIK